MKLTVTKASIDVTVYLFIQDSSVATGAGKTGLVFNTASLVAYYVRPLGSATAITLATQTVTGAHSDGGFVEVSSANMPGLYRLDLPDAVCATGVNSTVVMLKGAANMAPILLELQLVSYDPNDAVRLGLAALPNAAAEAAGGLYTRGTGAGQINQPANGLVDVNVERWNATAVPAEHTSGYPIVTIKVGSGAGELLTTSGRTAADMTHLGGSSVAANALEAAFDGTAGAVPTFGIVDRGTAQSATATTLVLRAAAAFANDEVIGATVLVTGGSAGVGQSRTITDYVSSTDTATVAAWTTTPTGTITYEIFASYGPDVGTIEADLNDIQTRLPAALVGGRMDASVGAMASNVMTAAAAAADLTTELQAGLAVPGSAMTLTSGERDSVADALLDRANAIETGLTVRQAHRLEAAAAAAKLSGAATSTVTIRNAVADSKDRIVASVDASGNRTAVTTDVT